jgi:uncharacterized DUF497 family protein
MEVESFIWDLEDDEEGNYWHIVVEGHGISRAEVEEVLSDPDNPVTESQSSGRPLTFGWTSIGRYIAVVWEEVNDDPLMIYPVTAYETLPLKE